MPTIIALDVSLSMTRAIPRSDGGCTYHQSAVQGINYFLDHLANNSKLEFVSLVIYSMLSEVVVDFTRDYETIRSALKRIQHYDKTSLENMLQTVSNILATNWGTQNYCQVLVFTDCGIGFGSTSIKNTIGNFTKKMNEQQQLIPREYAWLKFLNSSKLSFICIGSMKDSYYVQATQLYQQFLNVTGQKGSIFIPKSKDMIINNNNSNNNEDKTDNQAELNRNVIKELIERMCETNYKQFEALLKCGGYFRLECPILIWPPPMPHKSKDIFEKETVRTISKRLEICGFLALSDIGSPVSIGRHLIVPKIEHNSNEKITKSKEKQAKSSSSSSDSSQSLNEFEKLESDIKAFYSKSDGTNSDDEDGKCSIQNDCNRESVCVLLHGALKIENMAALVLLNDNWFGFIYSYADSKKKSNLMLNILPPGNNVIPWIGDLRLLGTIKDALPGENPSFPVKPEKRSYSQNCVVWIKQAGLQSDIQKVLRHAKKLPEKTPHFYKELNRIRRAALSLGFIELLEGLANIFEREITVLPQSASPDCAIQLKHAAIELRKIANRDLKTLIIAQPTKYNQL